MNMSINRRVMAAALLAPAIALATPAIASASTTSHPQPVSCDTRNAADEDGFGNSSVLPVVPVTTGDVVLLNGFAHDTNGAPSTSQASCEANQGGSGYGDDSVLPLLPITTGNIVAGNGFFEGDLGGFFGEDGEGGGGHD